MEQIQPIITSTVEERKNLVQELVKNTIMCCLKYPKNDDGTIHFLYILTKLNLTHCQTIAQMVRFIK